MGTIVPIMKYQDLNDANYLLYAMHNYTNSQCSGAEEFTEDLAIPIHLKKLFTRYHVNQVLKERLITNHIISFFNVFEPKSAATLLFYKLDPIYYSYLKTFLTILGRCPDSVSFNGTIWNLNKIEIDQYLLNRLNESLRIKHANP